MSKHMFQVTLQRKDGDLIDGGMVTFEDKDYDTFDDSQALQAILPGGGGPEELDLSLSGYIR